MKIIIIFGETGICIKRRVEEMKKIIAILLTGISILSFAEGVLANEAKIMWGKKFDEPVIDIIFDQEKMTVKQARELGAEGLGQRKDSEIVNVKCPKVIVTKEAVKFLNEEGKTIKEVELGIHRSFHASTNKKLIAVRKYASLGGEYQDLTIYDQAGIIRGEYKVKPLGGIITTDDGSFVVYGYQVGMMPRPGTINFYDSSGGLVKEIKEINGNPYFVYEGRYTPDNKFAIFLLDQVEKKEDSLMVSSVQLLCFDEKGSRRWGCILEDLNQIGLMDVYYTVPFDRLGISDDSKKVIVRGYSKAKGEKMTWVFSIDGNLIKINEGSWKSD